MSKNLEVKLVSSEASDAVGTKGLQFVMQDHFARILHCDFGLENDAVFGNWTVWQKLPIANSVKRLAIKVKDYVLAFGIFEGMISCGESGAGQVSVWGYGAVEPLDFAEQRIKLRLQNSRGQQLPGLQAQTIKTFHNALTIVQPRHPL